VCSQDRLDGLGGLTSVVVGICADVVMQDMCLVKVVPDVATNEAEVSVNSRGCTRDKGPGIGALVRQ